MDEAIGRLKFGEGTCRRHREMFVEICWEEGIRDPDAMQRVRMVVIAEAARRYSEAEMFAFLHSTCVGCTKGDEIIAIVHRVAQDEVKWMRIATQ
jgi:hypothetical protein